MNPVELLIYAAATQFVRHPLSALWSNRTIFAALDVLESLGVKYLAHE